MEPTVKIVAADVLCSLGDSLEESWANLLRNPRGGISPLPPHLQKHCASKAAGIMSGKHSGKAFDSALTVATQTFNQSSIAPNETALIVSTTKAEISELEDFVLKGKPPTKHHYLLQCFAESISRELGTASVRTISTACASGIVAILEAANMIRRGEAKNTLVIGVDVLSMFVLTGFSSLSALDEGPCKPFDQDRNGTTLGEGAGAILLTEGDCRPLAYVRGGAIASDANHITGPSREASGLTKALAKTLKTTYWQTNSINIINVHGTGTIYNDEMESKALRNVFRENIPTVVGFKGSIGHTLGAAGAIETALSIQAMRNSIVPATFGYSNPGTSAQLPLLIENKDGNIKRVLCMKSGFGGINAVLALEAFNE